MADEYQGGSQESAAQPADVRDPARATPSRGLELGRTDDPEATDETYEPSTVQVNHGREQGLGMGAKDLAGQRDATRLPSTDQYGRDDDSQVDPNRRA